MSHLEHKRKDHYTWHDYQCWSDEDRWEVINGDAFNMSPAPTIRHQTIVHNLEIQLDHYFKGKKCMVFPAPTDVKLSDEDIVQPDISVIGDLNQLKDTHVDGAPSLVIEVLSPATEIHDRHDKRKLYARSGVKEYWIITPFPSLVEVYVLKNKTYSLKGSYTKDQILDDSGFKGLTVDLRTIFDFPLKEDEQKLLELKEPPEKYRAN